MSDTDKKPDDPNKFTIIKPPEAPKVKVMGLRDFAKQLETLLGREVEGMPNGELPPEFAEAKRVAIERAIARDKAETQALKDFFKKRGVKEVKSGD